MLASAPDAPGLCHTMKEMECTNRVFAPYRYVMLGKTIGVSRNLAIPALRRCRPALFYATFRLIDWGARKTVEIN